MKTRVAPLLPLVLMLFLATLTLWLQYAVLEGSGIQGKPAMHEPDATVENFMVQRLDADGRLQYTFSAPRMSHFADDGSGEVLYPRVVQIGRNGADVTATANRGTVSRQGEEAFLYGNVQVMRAATPQAPEFHARTEFLHVLPEQGISRTDHSVTITEGRSMLSGVGLVIDKNRQQFTLQSQVRGVFDVPAKKKK